MAPAGSNRQLRTLGDVLFHFLHETRVHVPVILGVGAALGAYFASGILRVVLVVLAALLGALVVWDVMVVVYVTILVWGFKRWLDQRRARGAGPQTMPDNDA